MACAKRPPSSRSISLPPSPSTSAISARTKAALAPAKANGKRLGNYQRAEAKQRATAARAEAVRPAITATAHLSMRVAAGTLNRRGIRTGSGKQWHAMQVLCVRHRLDP